MDAITKNPQISAAILLRVTQGETLPQAIDSVLGVGTYAKVASDIYDTLRTKAVTQ